MCVRGGHHRICDQRELPGIEHAQVCGIRTLLAYETRFDGDTDDSAIGRQEGLLEGGPVNGRGYVRRVGTKRDVEGDDAEIDMCRPRELRPPDMQVRADINRDGVRAEEGEGVGRAQVYRQRDVIVEGLPAEQEIEGGIEPGAEVARMTGRLHMHARHPRRRSEGTVCLALNADRIVDLPLKAQARHRRVVRGHNEGWMIAAERLHKIARVLTRKPGIEGKAPREMAATGQQIRG